MFKVSKKSRLLNMGGTAEFGWGPAKASEYSDRNPERNNLKVSSYIFLVLGRGYFLRETTPIV
jgi:hypothetical protein